MKYKIAFSKMTFTHKPTSPDWEKLNTSFVNSEVEPIKFADLIYRGHPFCAWMNDRRKKENFLLSQCIGVDMDTGDERSSFEALQRNPLVLQYGAMMYETPSHAIAHPRTRVLFFLDEPIKTLSGYELALEAIYNLFPGADPSCVEGARFFYGNGLLREMNNPDGIWMDGDMVIPLADLRRMAKQYQLTEKKRIDAERSERKEDKPPSKEDKMSLLELQRQLDKVDPYSGDYSWWFRICCAIAHEYGDSAFSIAKNWSDRPGKGALTTSKWRDMLKEHGNPAGYGTIVMMLQERGVRV